MVFNLKEKCDTSSKRECFYGAKINKNIKDAYLGLCFLEPNETNRKIGPGKGHEEILYLMNGQIKIVSRNIDVNVNEGEAYHIPDGLKVTLTNLTDDKCFFIIAGGHTKRHSH